MIHHFKYRIHHFEYRIHHFEYRIHHFNTEFIICNTGIGIHNAEFSAKSSISRLLTALPQGFTRSRHLSQRASGVWQTQSKCSLVNRLMDAACHRAVTTCVPRKLAPHHRLARTVNFCTTPTTPHQILARSATRAILARSATRASAYSPTAGGSASASSCRQRRDAHPHVPQLVQHPLIRCPHQQHLHPIPTAPTAARPRR